MKCGRGTEPLFDVEQQNLVELIYRFGSPVVTLHQRFTGTARKPVCAGARRGHLGVVSKRFGHRCLQVKHQPVFTAIGQCVQTQPNEVQQCLVGLELAHFQRCGQSLAAQFVPAATKTGCLGHPENDLQVPQTSWRFLAVGLQCVRGVFLTLMALAHFERLGHKEGLGVHRLVQRGDQSFVLLAAATNQPAFQCRGLDGHVAQGFFHAFTDFAHAGANVQPAVPAPANELFQLRFQRRVGFRVGIVRQQHQHIDVRIGKQLATPETAHGHQRMVSPQTALGPQLAQQTISQVRQLLQRAAYATGRTTFVLNALQQGFFVALVLLSQQMNLVGRRNGGHAASRWVWRAAGGTWQLEARRFKPLRRSVVAP